MISVETATIGYSIDAHTEDRLTYRAGFQLFSKYSNQETFVIIRRPEGNLISSLQAPFSIRIRW
jgi:hypothetical protein